MYQYNPFSLEGKVILITGASSGIGRATAIECAKMGASLIITGRDEERLKETFAKLEGFKNKVHMQIVADLSTEDGIKDLVNQIPQINGCVSNAGIVGLTPIQFVTTKKIEEMQQINLMAPVLLIKQILKQKKFQSQASIVLLLLLRVFTVFLWEMLFIRLRNVALMHICAHRLWNLPQRVLDVIVLILQWLKLEF